MNDLFSILSDFTALTALEIILGIDNIVFIAIVTAKLPEEQRSKARRIGLIAAMATRILLLMSLYWIREYGTSAFLHFHELFGDGVIGSWFLEHKEYNEVSAKDVILLLGGLFLIAKSVFEIHEKMEELPEVEVLSRTKSFASVILQIAILDIVFSLDSVITAVGIAEDLWVMVAAIVVAIVVMMIFANSISNFVERNPTIKMLALSFLILIGVMLVSEGAGAHVDKGYIYFAMAFSLVVEFLNIRIRGKHKAKVKVKEKA